MIEKSRAGHREPSLLEASYESLRPDRGNPLLALRAIALGLAGLTNRAGARGRRRKLTAAQEATFAAWVREGPKPDVHKVVRWRCRDLQGEIARHFGVEMHERTVGKLLARLNFSRVSVRPRHPEQDIAAQEAHKKTSPSWSPRPFPSMLGASRSSCGGRMKHASASREA